MLYMYTKRHAPSNSLFAILNPPLEMPPSSNKGCCLQAVSELRLGKRTPRRVDGAWAITGT